MKESANDIEVLTQQLREVAEEQAVNEKERKKLERLEEDVGEFYRKEARLFDDFLSTWQRDSRMRHFLVEQQRSCRREQALTWENIEERREMLQKERRQLQEKETEFFTKRRTLTEAGKPQ
ncbi:Protein of unknown function [Evansella caseinilytica]|uniref:Uncharacterized protein n=2 Tax=Evansella caseinilytica TaxID=1503961 RepID=A0A1H3V2V6_9BACI|nr:DUF3958 family protein [Evansella caseinilytica]SDZ69014.1 Protein of unknown function [Evansella caseinilytica]